MSGKSGPGGPSLARLLRRHASTPLVAGSLPPGWKDYLRELESTQGAAGKRRGAYWQGEVQGRRVLWRSVETPQGPGFLLFPHPSRRGTQGWELYLPPAARPSRRLRAALIDLRRTVRPPLLTLPERVLGVPEGSFGRTLRGLGFRRIRRQRLSLPLPVDRERPIPPGVLLRSASPGDLPRIVRLSGEAYRDHIDGAFGPGANVRLFGPAYLSALWRSRYGLLDRKSSSVALRSGRLVGVVLVTRRPSPHIQELSVHPSHRGRGIGSALLGRVFRELRRARQEEVSLGVTLENPTGAYRMYRRLGFRPVPGTRGRMDGLWIDETGRRRLKLRILHEGTRGRAGARRPARTPDRGGSAGRSRRS